jgi:hypothetical protein
MSPPSRSLHRFKSGDRVMVFGMVSGMYQVHARIKPPEDKPIIGNGLYYAVFNRYCPEILFPSPEDRLVMRYGKTDQLLIGR